MFTVGLLKSLGSPVNAVFSTSDVMYWELERAGMISGDRVWRLPFWKYFRSRITGECIFGEKQNCKKILIFKNNF